MHSLIHISWNRVSSLNSGWFEVAMILPCLTATTWASGPSDGAEGGGIGRRDGGTEARISRGGRGDGLDEEAEGVERRVWMTGARMKMPGKGIDGSSRLETCSGCSKDSVCRWANQPRRATLTRLQRTHLAPPLITDDFNSKPADDLLPSFLHAAFHDLVRQQDHASTGSPNASSSSCFVVTAPHERSEMVQKRRLRMRRCRCGLGRCEE